MKKIGGFSLALTFAGCFLGAGYVSGKELWQYFGAFGTDGIYGLILSLLLQFAFGYMLIRLSSDSGICQLDKIIIRKDMPVFRSVVGGVSVFFLFGIFVVMAAGAGSLLNRILGLNYALCCAAFCAVVALTAYFGISGMVKGFSLIVPLLSVACIGICILQLAKGLPLEIEVGSSSSNPHLGGWLFSSINYAAYNMFGTIGILCPIAVNINKKSTALSGTALGCFILLAMAVGILLALCTCPSAVNFDLPMLELAYGILPVMGVIYSILLFLGMFGTSMSSLVACKTYFEQKFPFLHEHKIAVVCILSTLAFLGSLFGFGELVSIVYPICGYLGIIALILIAEHYFYIRKIMKKKEKI